MVSGVCGGSRCVGVSSCEWVWQVGVWASSGEWVWQGGMWVSSGEWVWQVGVFGKHLFTVLLVVVVCGTLHTLHTQNWWDYYPAELTLGRSVDHPPFPLCSAPLRQSL